MEKTIHIATVNDTVEFGKNEFMGFISMLYEECKQCDSIEDLVNKIDIFDINIDENVSHAIAVSKTADVLNNFIENN